MSRRLPSSAILLFYIAPFVGLINIYFKYSYAEAFIDGCVLLFLVSHIFFKKLRVRDLSIWLITILIFIGIIQIFNPYHDDYLFKIKGFRVSAYYMIAFYLGYWAKVSDGVIYRFILWNWKIFILVSLIAIQELLFPTRANLSYAALPGVGTTFYGDSYNRLITEFRIYGPFPSSTVLGAYALWIVALGTSWFASGMQKSTVALAIAGIAVAVIGMTYSRTAIGACFISILFIIYRSYEGKRFITMSLRIAVALIFIGIVSVIIVMSVPSLERRVNTLLNLGHISSFNSRIALWSERIGDIRQSVLGYGTGTAGFQDINQQVLVADNQYLKYLIEWGWVGGGLFIILCIFLIKRTFAPIKTFSKNVRVFCISIDAYLIGMLVMMMFGQILEGFPVGYMFWWLIGVRQSIGTSDHQYTDK